MESCSKPVPKVSSVEILKNRRSCDLCLKDQCSKRCKHSKNYTFSQIKKAYDEAIAFMECRPITCPDCGRGIFDIDRFCSHCGAQVKNRTG